MVFSSSLFLLYFFPAFLILYYLAQDKYKNHVALFASIAFYAWGGPKFIFLVIATLLLDFIIAKESYKCKGNKRKIWLAVGVTLNLGLLGFFKYSNFFVENINAVLISFGVESLEWTKIALPIGISFFTFQKMSYIIDVYRNEKPPMKSFVDYSLYILFFPQLIAGPIIRFNEVADQIRDRKEQETIDNKLVGFFRFCIGLAKKVLIANTMGATADAIFQLDPTAISTSMAWMGVIAYAFQIYFDFSGYSDMAIGIARMVGFIFPENFDNPYTSQSISEFWRRWHMTLSRWMKDYLYISLGGNKVKTKFRLFFNLWLVFLISGFWHGAAWNFIVWGAFHGFFLIMDRLFLLKFYSIIGKLPSIAITFVLTLIGWVLFRAESLEHALEYIKSMFSVKFSLVSYSYGKEFWLILIFAVLFSFNRIFPWGKKLEEFFFGTDVPVKKVIFLSIFCVFVYILCVSFVTSSGFNPFIYFRF